MEIQAPANTGSPSNENNAVASSTARPPVGLILAVFLQSILWIAVIILLVKLVPRFIKIFEDFNTELPRISMIVIDASHFLYSYWYVFLPLLILFCVGDFVLSYFLFHRQKHGVLGTFWRIGMFALPICWIILILLGCFIPLIGTVIELS